MKSKIFHLTQRPLRRSRHELGDFLHRGNKALLPVHLWLHRHKASREVSKPVMKICEREHYWALKKKSSRSRSDEEVPNDVFSRNRSKVLFAEKQC